MLLLTYLSNKFAATYFLSQACLLYTCFKYPFFRPSPAGLEETGKKVVATGFILLIAVLGTRQPHRDSDV